MFPPGSVNPAPELCLGLSPHGHPGPPAEEGVVPRWAALQLQDRLGNGGNVERLDASWYFKENLGLWKTKEISTNAHSLFALKRIQNFPTLLGKEKKKKNPTGWEQA